MADQKSKLPDLSEITSMAGKFFKDVKTSISQIIDEYKAKHSKSEVEVKPATQTTTVSETKVEVKVEEKPKVVKEKAPDDVKVKEADESKK